MKAFVTDVLRLFLGTVYASAGCLKALDMGSFVYTIDQFGIIPKPIVLPVAVLIIVGEVFLGVALAAKFRPQIISFFLASMTCIFNVGILIAVANNRSINCDCFGQLFPEQIGVGVLARDAFLIAGCLWISFQKKGSTSRIRKALPSA
ncbi:MAG TPA: MauE/DoxX family redox-associated membrane protein [Bacteroidota bacterium]|nr:MauE/DoxX family redox-associated membrane protein [Bacteroidota bacterium]